VCEHWGASSIGKIRPALKIFVAGTEPRVAPAMNMPARLPSTGIQMLQGKNGMTAD
jgi:hypothetical protein